MNSDIAALLVGSSSGDSEVTFLLLSIRYGSIGALCCGFSGLELLVGVVDEILLVSRHGGRAAVVKGCRMKFTFEIVLGLMAREFDVACSRVWKFGWRLLFSREVGLV